MIPENCRDCPFTNSCRAAHYGGSLCRYEKEIVEKILAAEVPPRAMRD